MFNMVETVSDLSQYILNSLISKDKIEDESLPILEQLIDINKLGLITFESQPHDVSRYTNRMWIKRSYLNGMFPKELVQNLAQKLVNINPNIVVNENVLMLNPKDDYLQLYNFKDDQTPLVNDLYPMALNIENEILEWISGKRSGQEI